VTAAERDIGDDLQCADVIRADEREIARIR
jgi:hypothetical protein